MRGRWAWVLGLTLSAAIAAAAVTNGLTNSLYRLAATLEVRLGEEGTEPILHADAWRLAKHLRTHGLIQRALASDRWRALGLESDAADVHWFARRLEVKAVRGWPGCFRVAFTATEEQVSIAAALCMLDVWRSDLADVRRTTSSAPVGPDSVPPLAAPNRLLDVDTVSVVRIVWHRRIAAAVAGSLTALLILGAGLLVTTLDARIVLPQSTLELVPSVPLLGSVPRVRPHGRRWDHAALSIHEIRALLEVRSQSHRDHAIAVTSTCQGAGTTSLSVGLACSWACSGTRTLIVDCDFCDADATASNGPRLSPITANNGSHARNHDAKTCRRRSIEQALVQMDLLKLSNGASQENDAPRTSTRGLRGVLAGAALSQCIVSTGIENLAVLLACDSAIQDVGLLSAQVVQNLIRQAQDDFDVVLFDTGPVPGAMAAMFITAAADATLLVVPHSESESRLRRTLSHLSLLGAIVEGAIFNDAPRTASTTRTRASWHLKRVESEQEAQVDPHRTGNTPAMNGPARCLLLAAVQSQWPSRCGGPHSQDDATAPERSDLPRPEASPWGSAGAQEVVNELMEDTALQMPGRRGETAVSNSQNGELDAPSRRPAAEQRMRVESESPTSEAAPDDDLDAQIQRLLEDAAAADPSELGAGVSDADHAARS